MSASGVVIVDEVIDFSKGKVSKKELILGRPKSLGNIGRPRNATSVTSNMGMCIPAVGTISEDCEQPGNSIRKKLVSTTQIIGSLLTGTVPKDDSGGRSCLSLSGKHRF